MAISCPSSLMDLTSAGYFSAHLPVRKNVTRIPWLLSVERMDLVGSPLAPASNVSAIILPDSRTYATSPGSAAGLRCGFFALGTAGGSFGGAGFGSDVVEPPLAGGATSLGSGELGGETVSGGALSRPVGGWAGARSDCLALDPGVVAGMALLLASRTRLVETAAGFGGLCVSFLAVAAGLTALCTYEGTGNLASPSPARAPIIAASMITGANRPPDFRPPLPDAGLRLRAMCPTLLLCVTGPTERRGALRCYGILV